MTHKFVVRKCKIAQREAHFQCHLKILLFQTHNNYFNGSSRVDCVTKIYLRIIWVQVVRFYYNLTVTSYGSFYEYYVIHFDFEFCKQT